MWIREKAMNATIALEILKQTGQIDLFDIDVGHLLIQQQENSLFLVTQKSTQFGVPDLPPLLVNQQQAEDFIHAHFAQVALMQELLGRETV